MAVYAIGDVQGCFDELENLLKLVEFDPSIDQAWLAGDLVNRGPKSAEVIRFAKQMGADVVKVVLGNHDLHLLATAAGINEHKHKMDTMGSILDADDREQLITWLRHQPLFHHDAELGFSMLHAGLPPQWSLKKVKKRAKEVEDVLRGDDWRKFFKHMYGNKPDVWSKELAGWDRLRFITNCLTRLRYCHEDGRLALTFKGEPKDKLAGQIPWFDMPNRKTKDDRIIFGHWSTLGTGQYDNVFSVDSGAVWGEQLTAVRIDKQPYQWFMIDANPVGLPHIKNKKP